MPGPRAQEQVIVRLWIETGAAYPGTYAALGCGMVGGWAENKLDRSDTKGQARSRPWTPCDGAVAAMPSRLAGFAAFRHG